MTTTEPPENVSADSEQTCVRGCCRGPNAQAEHYRTVSLGAGDANEQVADINRREKQLGQDRDAYQRLRRDGLQPHSVKDSASLEGRVNDQVEIDFKRSIPAKDLPRVREIQAEVAMSQWGGSVNG